jgi:hypothetical protein
MKNEVEVLFINDVNSPSQTFDGAKKGRADFSQSPANCASCGTGGPKPGPVDLDDDADEIDDVAGAEKED